CNALTNKDWRVDGGGSACTFQRACIRACKSRVEAHDTCHACIGKKGLDKTCANEKTDRWGKRRQKHTMHEEKHTTTKPPVKCDNELLTCLTVACMTQANWTWGHTPTLAKSTPAPAHCTPMLTAEPFTGEHKHHTTHTRTNSRKTTTHTHTLRYVTQQKICPAGLPLAALVGRRVGIDGSAGAGGQHEGVALLQGDGEAAPPQRDDLRVDALVGEVGVGGQQTAEEGEHGRAPAAEDLDSGGDELDAGGLEGGAVLRVLLLLGGEHGGARGAGGGGEVGSGDGIHDRGIQCR
ncbi:MAG: hypothetical protein ACK5XN_27600, partial [Bacteroidota bacterium]